MNFVTGFSKTAGIADAWKKLDIPAPKLDKAGLGMLALAPAYHIHKAIKDKDTGSAVAGATELGGLGLLYRAVQKGHG